MRILNATRKIKSVMTDKGTLMQIEPGQLSESFIATPNMVMGAVRLGTKDEIGIIYTSGYEFDTAKSVSVSLDYLYPSEKEAIAKLIKKDMDYTASSNNNFELEKANLIIGQCKKEIEELKGKLESKDASNETGDESELVKELKEKINELQKKHDTNNKKSKTDNSKIKELEAENSKLKDGLEKAIKQIEEMKIDFNDACTKFNLNKKDGEWVQETN